jgi:hypothetical protein
VSIIIEQYDMSYGKNGIFPPSIKYKNGDIETFTMPSPVVYPSGTENSRYRMVMNILNKQLREEMENDLFQTLKKEVTREIDREAIYKFKFFVKNNARLIDPRDFL